MKNVFKYFKKILLGVLFIIIGYLLISVILSIIPVNKNFKESYETNYQVWIKSNGVHLDIVLPIKNKHFNWNDILYVPNNIENEINYVGFGWGDKDFYINTQEWSNLKFSIAFNALFVKTEAAIHLTYYKNLSENKKSIKLLVNKQQFENIQFYILKSFRIKDKKVKLIKNMKDGTHDRFYEANYSYSLFYTCNTWTNEALKKAGLPACIWTPFDKGILYQYRYFIIK